MPGHTRVGFWARTVEAALRLYSRLAPTERGGFRLARAARRLRPRDWWRDVFRTPDNLLLDLDVGTYPDCSMAYGLYELDTARTIKSILRPGDHFVDGGANIGYFSLLAARLVGRTGRVDAFEPQPSNRARLMQNLERNGLDSIVRVHPSALTDSAGEASIHFYAGGGQNHGCSTLFPQPDAATTATAVRTVRMDEALAGTRPTLVKLDLQGAESLAIAGMKKLLEGDRPPQVIVEYAPAWASQAGFAGRDMIDRLLSIQPRYRMYRIGWRLKRIEATNALFTPGAKVTGEPNLLFRAE